MPARWRLTTSVRRANGSRPFAALGLIPFAEAQPLLARLLDSRQPQDVQRAALVVLDHFNDPRVPQMLADAWPTLSPSLRSVAIEAWFARPQRIAALLDAIEQGKFQASEIEPARVQLLTMHSDAQIRARATKLFGSAVVGRRQDVIDAYRPVLKLSGDVVRGKAAFQKNCTTCHKVEGVGHEIGPNLATVKARGAEFILLNVLDPSREVNPQFVNYVVITDDGRALTGMIAAETATSLTLKRAEAVTDTVLRVNVEELRSTGLSLMPEGLEKQLDQQTLADVIAYLLSLP